MENNEKTTHITTSIPLSLWNLAREKNLKWNECMILGIKTMLNMNLPSAYGESYETPVEVKKIASTMQSTIDGLNDEIDKLRKK
jgi:hypothetical protein